MKIISVLFLIASFVGVNAFAGIGVGKNIGVNRIAQPVFVLDGGPSKDACSPTKAADAPDGSPCCVNGKAGTSCRMADKANDSYWSCCIGTAKPFKSTKGTSGG